MGELKLKDTVNKYSNCLLNMEMDLQNILFLFQYFEITFVYLCSLYCRIPYM